MVLSIQNFEVDDSTHLIVSTDTKRNKSISSFAIKKIKQKDELDCYGTHFHLKSADEIQNFINFLMRIKDLHEIVENPGKNDF